MASTNGLAPDPGFLFWAQEEAAGLAWAQLAAVQTAQEEFNAARKALGSTSGVDFFKGSIAPTSRHRRSASCLLSLVDILMNWGDPFQRPRDTFKHGAMRLWALGPAQGMQAAIEAFQSAGQRSRVARAKMQQAEIFVRKA